MPLIQFAIFCVILIVLYLAADSLSKPRKRIHDTHLDSVDERGSV